MAFEPSSHCQWSWIYSIVSIIAVSFLFLCRFNKYVRFHINYVIYFGFSALVAFMCVPLFVLRPFNVRNSLLAAFLGKHITKLLGITWEFRNGEILAEDRGGVIVANHQTLLDNLGLYNIWETIVKCAPVSKVEMFYMWPFGLASWLAGAVFIDRSNPKAANQLLDKTAELMKKEKVKMWMFPEGTRNKSGSLLPFKKGAFRIAINCQVPILPIVYSPYYFIDRKNLDFGSGKMIITALPAIPTVGLTMDDLDDLIATTRSIMLKTFNAVTQEVTGKHLENGLHHSSAMQSSASLE